MQILMASSLVLVALLAGTQGARVVDKVTPVEKVIQLIEKLRDESAAEGKEEAKAYDDFACFCKEQADEKLYAITKSKKKIAAQEAKIAMLEGEIDELNGQIADLKVKKTELEKEQKEADEKRAKEFEVYAVDEKDLGGAIEAMKGAIKALKGSKEGMTDAKLSLLSNKALQKAVTSPAAENHFQTMENPKQLQAVLALLGMVAAPGKSAAYEYRSNDIIATLEGLLKTFKQNKVELDTAEATTRNQFEMEKQARENVIKFTAADIEEKSKIVADKEAEKQQTEEAMKEETADMEADEAFMKELTSQGEKKSKAFDQRSNARSGELTALAKALEILKSGVQPNAFLSVPKAAAFLSTNKDAHEAKVQKHDDPILPAKFLSVEQLWAQEGTTDDVSFIQLRGAATGPSKSVTKALTFLARKASLLQSPVLSTLALKMQVALGKDHFVKVRGIIKDLIAKLEADAEAEAEQKGFCDKEMGEATSARDEAIGNVEAQTATIAEAESLIAKLVEDIDELANQVADLRKGLFEATELRAKEKKENKQTIADGEAGLEALNKAMDVLKEFYGEVFLQQSFVPAGAGRDGKTVSDMAPATNDAEYSGNKDAAKGIFGLLEVIQSDFERTIKTTTETEEAAQEEFEAFEKDSNDDIETKEKTKKEKQEKKKTTEADLIDAQEELKGQQELLAEAKDKLEKLHPLCVDDGVKWEEKRAKQKQEIEACKEALAILENWQS